MIPLPMLEELAELYDVSVDYILGRTDEKLTAGRDSRKDDIHARIAELLNEGNDE